MRFLTLLLLLLGALGQVRAAEVPVLSVQNASVREGNAGTRDLVFQVSLFPSATTTVAMDYATRSQSAVSGQDFTATRGRLLIPAGARQLSVSVPVNGDVFDENDETFALLFSARNVQLGASAIGTIRDDDTLF